MRNAKRQSTKDARRPVRPGTIRRALSRQIGEAALVLKSGEIPDDAIHDVRKKLKSARAKLRLLREGVGRDRYSRANAALRDAARPLGAVRDSKVMMDSVDALLERKGPRGRRLVLTALRGRLKQQHAAARAALEASHGAASSVARLQRVSRRIERWESVRAGRKSLTRSLERIYRKARKALRTVEAERSDESLHELRKQVKYLLEALTPADAAAIAPRKLVKRADRVASLLGEDHDLHVLDAALVAATNPAVAASADAVRSELAPCRSKLQKRALSRARKLLRRRPGAFAKRLRF